MTYHDILHLWHPGLQKVSQEFVVSWGLENCSPEVLLLLRPSHANFDFLFSNFAVRDFILFTLDFNTQPEMRINRKLKFVLMRSAFCRGVSHYTWCIINNLIGQWAYELLMSFENILKDSKNGQRFGVTLRHYQVKMVKVQTRIYKTWNNKNVCVSYGYSTQKTKRTIEKRNESVKWKVWRGLSHFGCWEKAWCPL